GAVTNNSSTNGAAGVDVLFGGASFDGVTLTGNKGDSGAAAVFGDVTVNNSLVENNTATGISTAGIKAILSTLTVTNITFDKNLNTGSVTGGSAVDASTVILVNTTVHNNQGGAAAVSGGSVDVRFSTVTGNLSTFGIGEAGGIDATTI